MADYIEAQCATFPDAPRQLLHTRQATFRGYARDDGLWELEAVLLDTKHYPFEGADGATLEPGAAVHDMGIRVILDDDLRVVAITSHMDAAPLGDCQQARSPLQALVGQRVGRGWRRAIDAAMGAEQGCTHLRELLFNLATAAFQTIPNAVARRRKEQGLPLFSGEHPPHFIGGCSTWRRDGPAVMRLFPRFSTRPPQEQK